jgi:hypothetical protein
MASYQELHRCGPGQEAARGQRFNEFLADVLRWGGLVRLPTPWQTGGAFHVCVAFVALSAQ